MSYASKTARGTMRKLEAMRDVTRLSEATLDDLAHSRGQIEKISGVRDAAPSQMLEMAKRFGLDESDIAQPRWRALEIIDTCRHCDVSNACFNYLVGDRNEDFTDASCPNAERYAETSLESSKTR